MVHCLRQHPNNIEYDPGIQKDSLCFVTQKLKDTDDFEGGVVWGNVTNISQFSRSVCPWVDSRIRIQ